MAQQNIYDNEIFFENFEQIRSNRINFNDLIETPILLSMLPDLCSKKILDIGCGMGQHAKQYSDYIYPTGVRKPIRNSNKI